MSTSTLTGLHEYLHDTLTPARINAILDEAERQIAAGETVSDEETWRKYDEEFAREEKMELAEV